MKVAVLTTSYPREPGDPAGNFVADAVERVRGRGVEVEVVSPASFRHFGIAYGSGIVGNPITYSVKGKQYVSVWSGIGGWIGLPVTAGLDLNDKFGAIGATAMAKAANLNSIPQGGTLYTFRIGDM